MKKLLFISNITNKITNFSYPLYLVCKDLGIEFHLAANLDNFDFQNNPYKDIIFHNIHCERNPFSCNNIKAYELLNKVIKEYNIDYIHCNTPVGGLLGRLSGRKNNVKKIIYTVHGFHFYKGAPLVNRILYKNIEKILSRFTDVLITINEEDYQSGKKMKLKANGHVYKINGVGIDTKHYINIKIDKAEKRKSLGLKDNDFVCIGTGRLEDNKNFVDSIKAISKTNNENIHLLICGEGPEKEKLVELTKELGLSYQIHFLGYRSDISELLNISDCFVSTSKREGLPRALMEAMASGIPCVAYDIRGNNDLLKNTQEVLVASVDDIAMKIVEIEQNRDIQKKLAEKNMQFIKMYDNSIVYEQISEIYKKELVR